MVPRFPAHMGYVAPFTSRLIVFIVFAHPFFANRQRWAYRFLFESYGERPVHFFFGQAPSSLCIIVPIIAINGGASDVHDLQAIVIRTT